MRNDLWIVECRKPDGSLDRDGRQPEEVFGLAAITGIDEDRMAKTVFARTHDGVALSGMDIGGWPSFIDSRWRARRKTW